MDLHHEVGRPGVLERTRHPIPSLRWDDAYVIQPEEPIVEPRYTVAAFQMETQQRPQWCWAAVSVSIDTLYAGRSRITQCKLVQAVRGGRCCEAGCDRPYRLEPPLRTLGRNPKEKLSAIASEEIETEVREERVIGALIRWRGGGGHFVVISGIKPTRDGALLRIGDPRHGASHSLPIGLLRSGYKGSGEWTATYLTKP